MRTVPRDRVELQEASSTAASGQEGLPLDPAGPLATRQVELMVAAWRRGEQILAEDILADHPELGDEAAMRLIYEEVCLRLEAGQSVDPAAIARRFPQWRDELEILLDCQLKMQGGPVSPAFPEVGETLAGFRLIWELGQGAAGRVFLASQPSLADRPVVLKITRLGREEHLSLARLQHMYIVPLYSEHVLQARGLQVLCMPFLGGATLGQILESLKQEPAGERTGRGFIDALVEIEGRLPLTSAAEGPYRDFLARSSYVTAICSIGACLADGLQYAHDRDLVHMDIKPSNVLLAGDGQPMLLDFHLARKPIRPGGAIPLWMGGTPEYMAPEQAQAVDCVRTGGKITVSVDERADLYSLGLLLYEALSGSQPHARGAELPPLDRINPAVSPGLSDIVDKCLSQDPGDRYRDAAALATDLRCHLADLPLRGVPNRSLVETWRKWRRRRPQGVVVGSMLVVLSGVALAAGSWAWTGYRQRVGEVRASLDEGRNWLRLRQYPAATTALTHGLAIAAHLPFVSMEKQELMRLFNLAEQRWKAAELHRLAELIRLRYAMGEPAPKEANWLLAKGCEVWEARGSLRTPIGERSRPELEENIRKDLVDFLSIWTELRVRLAPPAERDAARRESVQILSAAEAEFGPLLSFDRMMAAIQDSGGSVKPRPAMTRPPSSAWDCYEQGRSLLRTGEYQQAFRQFELGLELQPQDFWLNFYEGVCAYRLGKLEEAVHAFHICIVLSPGTAECYYNRGLAYQELGSLAKAKRDYDQALKLNPKLTGAALNRGVVEYQQEHLDEAAASLEQALDTALDNRTRCEVFYTQGLVELARNRRARGLELLKRAADGGHAKARSQLQRLQSER
ncbi:MAG: protein kinase domain-containing protein [Isosphaeraceae bacterium]